MRIAYQGPFHSNPDYAYWYGWAAMTKSLGGFREAAQTIGATHEAVKQGLFMNPYGRSADREESQA